jgi:transmembrane sensor
MNAPIRDTAAQWLVEFRTDNPSPAARRQFAVWLRTSPEHIKAYLNALALWEEAGSYDQQHRVDIDMLVALARTEGIVTDIPKVERPYVAVSRKPMPRRLLSPRTGIAALLSLAINCGLWWIAMDSRNSDYTTQIAEQRSVVLSDGSHVDLDALSNVRVKFTSHERAVELLSGQALFQVVKDAKRPFVVRADGARFRAVGTEFDVNRTTLGTVLTVLEGRVTVLAVSGASAAKVNAGQQVTISHDAITTPQATDTAAVTGWTRKLLIFASTPLPVVAEEFNRFNSRQLVIASPELVHYDFTGTLRAFDPETLTNFVLLLRRQPGIEVLEKADQITVLARSHSPAGVSLHM